MALTQMKMIRMRSGIRQSDVARAAGISESQMSKIENNLVAANPTILKRIATRLGVPIDELRREGC